MSIHQHAKITETLYFWFASNNTSGTGDDGASAAAYCRLAGAAASAANVYSPVPALLSDASYPAGCYEITVPATTGNGFADGSTYAVFCTLAVDAQNPTGFVGSFTLAPIAADLTEMGGVAQSAIDLKDFADVGYNPGTSKITGVVLVDTTTLNTDMVAAAPTVTQITADMDANSTDLNTIIAYVDELESRLTAVRAGYLDELAAANLPTDIANIKAETALIVLDTNELQTDDVPGLIAIAQADLDIITGASGVNLLAATQASIDAIELDTGTTLDTKLNDMQGGTFNSATDSLEALRNRGDSAWVTGAGGTPPDLLQSTTIATLASQTSFTLTAGSSDDNAYVNQIAIITAVGASEQKAVATISAYTGSSKTVTLSSDPAIFGMLATDLIDIVTATGAAGSGLTSQQTRDAMKLAATAGTPAAGSIDLALDNIEADTNELQADDIPGLIGALNDVAATEIVSGGAINTTTGAVDTVTTNTDMVGTDGANTTAPDNAGIAANQADLNTIITYVDELESRLTAARAGYLDNLSVGAVAQASVATEARLAELDAANLPANIDAVLLDTGTTIPGTITTLQSDTDDIQARIPAALISGRIDSSVSAINDNNAAALNLERSAGTIRRGTAAAGTLSTTEMTTGLTISVIGQLNGKVLIFASDTTTAALRDQATDITDTQITAGKLTFTALTTAPAATDTFVIV